ncbi:MAG: DUF418 domain-containing protein, partial [Syntrophaceae bacterium]|nr:DUF418 domain-containing protein [Syntrophaceae bacterium]
LTRPARHKRPLWILFASCLAVGLAANLVPPERVYAWTGGIPFRPLRVFLKLLFLFGREGLVVGYMSGLLLAAEWWNRKGKDSLLAAMGRMALTQYLLQSLACSLVFYGFGLGLFGKVPLNLCILGSILFFLFQAWTSRLWLKHFHSGPVEWLWRSLVYRTRPPFRRTRSSMIQTGAPEAG